MDVERPTRRFVQVTRGPGLDGGSLSPVKHRPRNARDRLVAVTDSASLWTFPQTGPFSLFIEDADRRALAADRNPDKMPNTCHLRGAAMQTVRFTSLSALKEVADAAKFSPRPEAPQVSMPSAPFQKIQSQTSTRSFYFPCNKPCRPLLSTIPTRVIPVTEVYKWPQQQPKLQPRQPQRIPSNVG